jgi:hypothetical protein
VKNGREFCRRSISFILRRVLQHAVKSHDMWPTALLPLRNNSCYRFLSPLKIHRPRPGMNPRTLGPVESMITTRPPRPTKMLLNETNNRTAWLFFRMTYTVISHLITVSIYFLNILLLNPELEHSNQNNNLTT